MASIGSFSSAVREADETVEPLSFEYNGEEYFLADYVPMLPFMHLAKLGSQGSGAEDSEAIAVMFDVLKACLKDEAEYNRFAKAAAREDGEVIFDITNKVIEGMMNRPFSSSSDSAAGQSKNGKPSNKRSGRRVSTANVKEELSGKRPANLDPEDG